MHDLTACSWVRTLMTHHRVPALQPRQERRRVGIPFFWVVEHITQQCGGRHLFRDLCDFAERSEETGEIYLGMLQQFIRIGDESGFVRTVMKQPELGGLHGLVRHGVDVPEEIQALLQRCDLGKERGQGVGEAHEIPLSHGGLLRVAIAATLGVGRVRCPVWVVFVKPAVGSVIDGQAEDGHVVRVHDTMDESHAHPVCDKMGGSFAHLVKPRDTASRYRALAPSEMRKIPRDREVDDSFEQCQVVSGCKDLEVTEPYERRGHSTHYGARLRRRMAVVEHVPHHRFPGRHQ